MPRVRSTGWHVSLQLGYSEINFFPLVHNRCSVEFIYPQQNWFFQFLFGFNAYMPQKGTSHFRKDRLNKIEP